LDHLRAPLGGNRGSHGQIKTEHNAGRRCRVIAGQSSQPIRRSAIGGHCDILRWAAGNVHDGEKEQRLEASGGRLE